MMNRALRTIVLIMAFYWFIRFSIYFGLNYELAHMEDKAYQSSVSLGISEVLATLLSGYIRLKYRQKNIFKGCFLTITLISILMFNLKIP